MLGMFWSATAPRSPRHPHRAAVVNRSDDCEALPRLTLDPRRGHYWRTNFDADS